MLFLGKSVKQNQVKNNPGADRPVWFWIKIPAENRVYPWARRRALDPIGNPS